MRVARRPRRAQGEGGVRGRWRRPRVAGNAAFAVRGQRGRPLHGPQEPRRRVDRAAQRPKDMPSPPNSALLCAWAQPAGARARGCPEVCVGVAGKGCDGNRAAEPAPGGRARPAHVCRRVARNRAPAPGSARAGAGLVADGAPPQRSVSAEPSRNTPRQPVPRTTGSAQRRSVTPGHQSRCPSRGELRQPCRLQSASRTRTAPWGSGAAQCGTSRERSRRATR